MPDELKTLLKIEGDASGAKAAAQEASKAVQNVAQASTQSTAVVSESAKGVAAQTGEAVKKTGSALEEMGTKATKASDKTAGAGEKGKQSFEALKSVLGRINPELGSLAELAMKGQGALAGLLTPAGAAGAGIVAAIGGIITAIRELKAEAEAATLAYEKLMAATERHLSKSAGREESAADAMAKAGKVGNAAVSKAAAIEKKLVGQGFKEESVRAVLPFAVDEEGNQILDDAQIQKLAAQQEFGVDQLKFDRPKDMARVLRGAQRSIDRDPQLVDKWVGAVHARIPREQARIAIGDRGAMAAKLGRDEPGLDQEQIQQAIRDVERIRDTGAIDTEGYHFTHSEDRLLWESRQVEAARRARSLGVISPEQMRKSSKKSLFGADMQPVTDALGTVSGGMDAVTQAVGGFGASDVRKAADWVAGTGAQSNGDPGQPRSVVNHNYHGPVYNTNPPDRARRHDRGVFE